MSADDSGERTIEPTPKRVRDFRERGDVAVSKDLISVGTLFGGLLTGMMFAEHSGRALTSMTGNMLEQLDGQPGAIITGALPTLASAAAPTMLGALAGCLAVGAFQLGWPIALKKPDFDLSKIVQLQNVGKIFSPQGMAGRALKAIAKVSFVAAACVYAMQREYRDFLDSPSLEARPLLVALAGSTARLILVAGGALALLAAFDFFWARKSLLKRMRMTAEELRREMREQEGEPLLKRKRRQRMRELARRRLVAVQKADILLVNPTHFAVALRYQQGTDRAPRVVAKGRDALAQRLRDAARLAGVPILERPPLTRLLYKLVPEGKEIPSKLYHAIAEVLAYVYRLRRRRA
ncbi:MAG: EscU/YscU/HrcU family type III secretion system export apparatus switch protein [Myxococcales bacterium]|nr:EscU/YscU/HrcU family type III secretion system export apparatus switch protein [Myxococcales bacterium]